MGGELFIPSPFQRGCGRRLVLDNSVLFSPLSAIVLSIQDSLLLFSPLDGGSICPGGRRGGVLLTKSSVHRVVVGGCNNNGSSVSLLQDRLLLMLEMK